MGIERGAGCPQNRMVSREDLSSAEAGGVEAKGLQIWGDIKFKADAVVGGTIQGSVDSTEKIIITQEATVSGSVRGSDIRVQGEVRGGVEGRGQVWVGPQAKVTVRCGGKAVRIEPGAEFRGELQVG